MKPPRVPKRTNYNIQHKKQAVFSDEINDPTLNNDKQEVMSNIARI